MLDTCDDPFTPKIRTTILKQYVVQGPGTALVENLLIKIFPGSGKSEIYFDPFTGEWHIEADECGGEFFVSGVRVLVEKDGSWTSCDFLDDDSAREVMHEKLGKTIHNLSFGWYKRTYVKGEDFKFKIGLIVYALKQHTGLLM